MMCIDSAVRFDQTCRAGASMCKGLELPFEDLGFRRGKCWQLRYYSKAP